MAKAAADMAEESGTKQTPATAPIVKGPWRLDGCLATLIPAQGHEPLHQRPTTLNCEEPTNGNWMRGSAVTHLPRKRPLYECGLV